MFVDSAKKGVVKRTNIEEKLVLAKQRGKPSEIILDEVRTILGELQSEREKIQKNIEGVSRKPVNAFNPDSLASEKIFHIEEIKKICINYRLRFLDSKLFKGAIPEEAISKIRLLENEHRTELMGFKVLAPSKMFKLKDKDDPMLFAPVGNGYFYLIHKWGTDLHPLRKFLMWPFKNIVNLALFILLLSYFLTLLIPEGLFSKSSSVGEFAILFFFMFKSIAAVVIFYGFAQGKNFSNAIWNSRFINT